MRSLARSAGWRRLGKVARIAAAALAVHAGGSSTAWAQSAAYNAASWARIVAAGKKEGSVHYYSSPPPSHAQKLIAAFRKLYPEIAVELVRASTGELMAKIDQERIAGVDGADIWVGTDLAWFQARAREGKLSKPGGPGLVGWPAQALMADAIVLPNRDAYVITYNKNLVKTPIRDYADMLRPEFKGKIGLSEATGGISQLAWYLWLEKTQGNDYLAKLRQQNPRLYAGASQMVQALVAGEIAVGPGVSNIAVAKPFMDQGAPIDYVVPSPVFGFQYATAAFAWSKRPNAALLFLDFIMSVEGQTVWHGSGESASPRKGIPGALDYSSITPFDPNELPPPVAKENLERWIRIFK